MSSRRRVPEPLNVKRVSRRLCSVEGGREQISIAQATEVIGLLGEILAVSDGVTAFELLDVLAKNGKRRLLKKASA